MLLDNMIWNAITTGNHHLAILEGEAGLYRSDIAPFAAMKEWNRKNWDQLYDMVTTEWRTIAVSHIGPVQYNASRWKLLRNLPCCQMVCKKTTHSFVTPQSSMLVRLTDEHIPQMLELTALTKPGPFLQKTILFENYFGIFVDDRLVAMTGQRMHPSPFMEVSAVCTHPDFRGQGYAKTCMLHVMELILENGFTPFLHVLTTNTSAIALYESIGFTIRTEIDIDVVKKIES